MMVLRSCTLKDLERLLEIESASYPPEEGATEESLRSRLSVFPRHFLAYEKDGRIVSFVNGMCTDERDLQDWMYEEAEKHDEKGAWQMIFSVVTAPEERGKGYASETLRAFIELSRQEGRKGIVLTCKERLLPFYSSFGFLDEGISSSEHGGVLWHSMRLVF